MRKKRNLSIISIMVPLIIASVCMFSVVLNNNQSIMTIPLELKLEGEYTYNGETWYPLTEESNLSAFDGKLTIKGHFQTDISEGTMLTFLCNHIGASIFVNGERIYIDTPMEIANYGIDLMPSMCGKRWEQVMCPKIEKNDEVEICFINYHEYGNEEAYREALSTFLVLQKDIRILEHYLQPYLQSFYIIGCILIIVSMLLIGSSITAFLLPIKSGLVEKLFQRGMITLFVGGYVLCDIMVLSLSDEVLVVKTYGRQLCLMLAVHFIGLSIRGYFTGKKKKIGNIMIGISYIVNIIIMCMVISKKTLIFDTQFIWCVLQMILCPTFVLCCMVELLKCEKEKRLDLSIYILLFLSILGDVAKIGASVYISGICFKVVFFMSVFISVMIVVKHMIIDHYVAREKEKLEEELALNRISIMMSQIRTHFIFNVMNSISALCKTDALKADKALIQFSRYLRRNISILDNDGLIYFSKELEHVEDYINLEKMRFQDRIIFEKEIQVQDFKIPPLTIQPLIENAIKHGFIEHGRSGTVKLCSTKDETDYIIAIIDDGVGFVQEDSTEKESIGIKNVHFRLKKMVKGTLMIESILGQGTKVTIRIPIVEE